MKQVWNRCRLSLPMIQSDSNWGGSSEDQVPLNPTDCERTVLSSHSHTSCVVPCTQSPSVWDSWWISVTLSDLRLNHKYNHLSVNHSAGIQTLVSLRGSFSSGLNSRPSGLFITSHWHFLSTFWLLNISGFCPGGIRTFVPEKEVRGRLIPMILQP